jgi:hypothetical protein
MVAVAAAAVRGAGRRLRASGAGRRGKDVPGASGRRAWARDSAMYCGGMRSTVRPMALAAVRVAGPMTAIFLGSWVRWRNWARRWKASTALGLVRTSQS